SHNLRFKLAVFFFKFFENHFTSKNKTCNKLRLCARLYFSLNFIRKVAFIKFGLINNNPEVVYSGFSITYEGKQVLVFILLSIRQLNWLILIREVSACKDLVS